MSRKLSKKYAEEIQERYDKLNKAFLKRNPFPKPFALKYHLAYTILYRTCWKIDSVQFANTSAEIEAYLQLLDRLGTLLRAKKLSTASKKDILKAEEAREQYAAEVIQAIGMDGVRLEQCEMEVFYMPEMSIGILTPKPEDLIEVKFLAQVKGYNAGANSSIFVFKAKDLATCECLKCLESNYQSCDIAEIEYQRPSVSRRKLLLPQGNYHFFVTQKSNNIEKIIHYEKRKITTADEGKTITLKVSDN